MKCTGPYNCPGKGLAMLALRSVISRTVHQYNISIPIPDKYSPKNFDPETFFNGITDQVTSQVPDCELLFEKR